VSVDFAALGAAFGQQLRVAGLPVTPARTSRFLDSIFLATPSSLDELYWLGRVNLISQRDHIRLYDSTFHRFFSGIVHLTNTDTPADAAPSGAARSAGDHRDPPSTALNAKAQAPPLTTATPGPSTDGDSDDDESHSLLAAASSVERLTQRDFAECSPEELSLLTRLVEQLPLVPPTRPARRKRRHRRGHDIDLRDTLRRARRTGGEPMHRARKRRTQKPRRVVLIADVSGSMEPYARVYLHLMRGAVAALAGAEAFVFATRLTRLTRSLADGSPDQAYREVSQATPDWSGGTRIGATIQEFVDTYGRRGMARGSVIVIVSDGWETVDPQPLARAMTQLHLLAHSIIWVNPRSAAAGFAPLAGGMAAALPHVDTFVSGHSLVAVEEVVQAIGSNSRRQA
jgi:uncharacterized protein with von Willebrand factor type A (vWA) domain